MDTVGSIVHGELNARKKEDAYTLLLLTECLELLKLKFIVVGYDTERCQQFSAFGRNHGKIV
jgi:hypothetical protein